MRDGANPLACVRRNEAGMALDDRRAAAGGRGTSRSSGLRPALQRGVFLGAWLLAVAATAAEPSSPSSPEAVEPGVSAAPGEQAPSGPDAGKDASPADRPLDLDALEARLR